MSRSMTAAQVVAAGDYLNPDFDPNTLTINQLLGVFGYHSINFPHPYTKSKLVALFNEEIKAKATKLKRERAKKESTTASDEGITDGVTGQPLTDKAEPARRSSRRLSRAPAEQELSDPPKPEPVKRRRSSAQPTLGGPSKRKVPAQPALAEESEPEEELMPKAIKKQKSSQESIPIPVPGSPDFREDSGWEDNNVFQSGAESSPTRPSPTKARAARKSTAAKPASTAPRRVTRKATSAPPEIKPHSPPRLPTLGRQPALPQTDFAPRLSLETKEEVRAMIRGKRVSDAAAAGRTVIALPSIVKEEDEPEDNELPRPDDVFFNPPPMGETRVVHRAVDPTEVATPTSEEPEDSQESAVAAQPRGILKRDAELVRYRSPEPVAIPGWLRFLLAFLTLLFMGGVYEYKSDSASIGFCDTGSNTNDVLEQRRLKLEAIEACHAATHLDSAQDPGTSNIPADTVDTVSANKTDCPALPLIPLLHPTTCTPCPAHASCSRHTVHCDNGYIPRPHPLLAMLPSPPPSSPASTSDAPSSSASELVWSVVSGLTDGMPGLGPVAFPPRCVSDPKRKRRIGFLGKALESLLGQERGKRLCNGDQDFVMIDSAEGGEARRWGMELGALKDALKVAMKRKASPQMMDTFDDTFHEAIQQLIQGGDVITGEDSTGKKYLAHETPDMSWNCALTVKTRDTWRAWRTNVFGAIAFVLAVLYGGRRRNTRRLEDKRVAALVPEVMSALKRQETAHYTDPVTYPEPYLSSLRLRDIVLQHETSVTARSRLWHRVERIVEANANVRTNLQEVADGDEMRVWRWIGGTARELEPPGSEAEADDGMSPDQEEE